jgi:hypothetical protein
MAITLQTAGEQLVHIPTGNVKAMIPVAGYTAPEVGDLVIYDTSENNAVDAAANNENPVGEILSVNRDNGILSVALYKSGTRVILPYSGVVAVGNKIESTGTREIASVDQGKTVVAADGGGVGTVVAVDVPAAARCVVEF